MVADLFVNIQLHIKFWDGPSFNNQFWKFFELLLKIDVNLNLFDKYSR